MKANKVVAAGMAAILALGVMGCGGTPQQKAEASEEEQAAHIVGGWTVNTDTNAAVTGHDKEVFDKATSELDGVDYEPVAVIGQQVVAGMNYAYLCKATAVVPDAETTWSVVTIYEDLQGNASVSSITGIDLADLQVLANSPDGRMSGAWAGTEPETTSTLPDDADKAFQEAAGKLTDADPKLTPVALLGTQVVAGVNYLVLCEGTSGESATHPYVVVVYKDASGSSEITSMDMLDLTAYIGTHPTSDES